MANEKLTQEQLKELRELLNAHVIRYTHERGEDSFDSDWDYDEPESKKSAIPFEVVFTVNQWQVIEALLAKAAAPGSPRVSEAFTRQIQQLRDDAKKTADHWRKEPAGWGAEECHQWARVYDGWVGAYDTVLHIAALASAELQPECWCRDDALNTLCPKHRAQPAAAPAEPKQP